MEEFQLVDIIKFPVTHSRDLGVYQFSACEVTWKMNLDPETFIGLVPASEMKNDILVEMVLVGSRQLHSGPSFNNPIGIKLRQTRKHLYRVTDAREHQFYHVNLYGMKIEIQFYER